VSETAEVSGRTKQAESTPTQWAWVDRTIWTERMLAALGNGVKGNKWFSLIDKVYRPSTLQAAWEQVKANRGAAGIDRQSIEGFAANAERYLNELAKGYTHIVDADLKGYFDSIPHPRLKERIEERISDGRLLELLAGWLRQDIVKGLERWTPTGGTPQGAVISPLLANLYLHPLDETMLRLGYRMVRYADDFVILCKSAEQAYTALEEVNAWVEANGLTLHPDKTHIGDCRIEGQGFEFLGYRFEAGKRRVRKKSLQGFKDKIREKTRRTRGDSLTWIIADLTPMIRGWYGYFKHAARWEFPRLDGFIRRRLRAILRKQEKRPGIGKCHADHKRWPNAYFAELGLFTMTEARMSASQSR